MCCVQSGSWGWTNLAIRARDAYSMKCCDGVGSESCREVYCISTPKPGQQILSAWTHEDRCQKIGGVHAAKSDGTHVCCAGSCGRCGGADCALAPGGAQNCCLDNFLSADDTDADGKLRLVDCVHTGSDAWGEEWGKECCRAEIKHNGEWGTICHDNKDHDLVAKVICRELGTPEDQLGSVEPFEEFGAYYRAGVNPIWLDELDCTGDELHLLDCAHDPFGDHDCGASEDFGVCCPGFAPQSLPVCGRPPCLLDNTLSFPTGAEFLDSTYADYSAAIPKPQDTVRLRDCVLSGTDAGCCRAEVKYAGQWGTLCDTDNSADDAAKVMCRQLGCAELTNVKGKKGFGGVHTPGTGRIWLDSLDCDPDAHNTWQDCTIGFGGSCNANHLDDFGVCCIGCGLENNKCHINTRGDMEKILANTRVNEILGGDAMTVTNVQTVDDTIYMTSNAANYPAANAVSSKIIKKKAFATSANNVWTLQFAEYLVGGPVLTRTPERERNVRLQDCVRNGADEGCCRVEILHHGVWGTMCDDLNGRTDETAKVVCREVGCSPERARGKDGFGAISPGKGPIWLDELECSGDELTVLDCNDDDYGDGDQPESGDYAGWGFHDCDHGEDFGVCCLDCADPPPAAHHFYVATTEGWIYKFTDPVKAEETPQQVWKKHLHSAQIAVNVLAAPKASTENGTEYLVVNAVCACSPSTPDLRC